MKQTHPCVTFGGSHRRQSNANRCSPIHNHLSKRRGETQMLDSSGARCMQAFRPILCKSACVALLRSHGQENHKYDFFVVAGGGVGEYLLYHFYLFFLHTPSIFPNISAWLL